MRSRLTLAATLAIAVLTASVLAACGSSDSNSGLSGTIKVDGSSTVGPITSTASELFNEDNPDVKISVGTSGTGGGFEKFCAGETDMNDASREIEPEEVAACKKNNVTYDTDPGCQRRHRGRGQPREHLGQVPDDGPAQEDLGQGLQRQQLEPGRPEASRTSR